MLFTSVVVRHTQPTPMDQRHTAVVSLRCRYDLRGTTACLCTGVRGGCTRGGGGEALKCTAHSGPTLTVSHTYYNIVHEPFNHMPPSQEGALAEAAGGAAAGRRRWAVSVRRSSRGT